MVSHKAGWLSGLLISPTNKWRMERDTLNRWTRQRTSTQADRHLLPLELHHSAGGVDAPKEGGRRVVLIVHGHGEGHHHLLLERAHAHCARGHQLVLLPALSVQGPARAHLQAVSRTAEGLTLTCAPSRPGTPCVILAWGKPEVPSSGAQQEWWQGRGSEGWTQVQGPGLPLRGYAEGHSAPSNLR